MSKMMRAAIIGGVVALAVSFGLAFFMSSMGANPGIEVTIFGAMIGLFTFYILANLAGNKASPLADKATREAALSLVPPRGKGLVVVVREGFVAKAAGMNITLDGTERAQLKAPRFTAIAVDPGTHVLTAAFGGLAGAQNTPGEARFDIGAGEVAAFRIGVSMGLTANVIKLERLVDLAQAKAKLSRIPMVAPVA